MNRILLRLSKTTDLDLYAYFSHVEYRKSTLVKQLLRDYIRKESTVRIRPLHITYDSFTDPDMPKILTISIQLNEQDKDITDYFSDCPNGYRSKCMKSILRIMLAPYTQSAFHREPVESYVPVRQYMENETVNPANPYPNGYPQMGQFPYPYPYPYPMMYGTVNPAYMMNPQADLYMQQSQVPQTQTVQRPDMASHDAIPTPAEPVSRMEQFREEVRTMPIPETPEHVPEIPISTPIRDVPIPRNTEESVSENVNDSNDEEIPEWKIPSPTPIEENTSSFPVESDNETCTADDDVDDAMFALLTGDNY